MIYDQVSISLARVSASECPMVLTRSTVLCPA